MDCGEVLGAPNVSETGTYAPEPNLERAPMAHADPGHADSVVARNVGFVADHVIAFEVPENLRFVKPRTGAAALEQKTVFSMAKAISRNSRDTEEVDVDRSSFASEPEPPRGKALRSGPHMDTRAVLELAGPMVETPAPTRPAPSTPAPAPPEPTPDADAQPEFEWPALDSELSVDPSGPPTPPAPEPPDGTGPPGSDPDLGAFPDLDLAHLVLPTPSPGQAAPRPERVEPATRSRPPLAAPPPPESPAGGGGDPLSIDIEDSDDYGPPRKELKAEPAAAASPSGPGPPAETPTSAAEARRGARRATTRPAGGAEDKIAIVGLCLVAVGAFLFFEHASAKDAGRKFERLSADILSMEYYAEEEALTAAAVLAQLTRQCGLRKVECIGAHAWVSEANPGDWRERHPDEEIELPADAAFFAVGFQVKVRSKGWLWSKAARTVKIERVAFADPERVTWGTAAAPP